jgi:hypothetical protein
MATPDFQFQGHQPSSEQVQMAQLTADYWRKVSDAAPVEAIARIEEAAKQLIGLTGALQGLYLAVFAFSDLRKQIGGLHVAALTWLIWLIFLLPIVMWLISLLCATMVFVPKPRSGANTEDTSVNAWQEIKDTYEKTANDKLTWLHRSHLALVFSFGAVLIVLITFILLPASVAPEPTPIIIVTPTPTP